MAMGWADWPCEELGGKTPAGSSAQAEYGPSRIARDARDGRATIPIGMPSVQRRSATMTMLGLRLRAATTPAARRFEAASMGISNGFRPTLVFRMNLVSASYRTTRASMVDERFHVGAHHE